MERVLQEILHSSAERGFSFLIGSKRKLRRSYLIYSHRQALFSSRTELEDALNEYANKPKYQRLVIEFEKGEGDPPLRQMCWV
jgi:leukotriene-A4 hydrolase